MSKFDYRDPGQDPEYCNPLSDEPDPIESDLHDLHSTLASLVSQAQQIHSVRELRDLHQQLKPIEDALWKLRLRLADRAEALTMTADQQLWGV